MDKRNRQKQANNTTYYSEDQVRRSIIAAGLTISYEVENDIVVFCPYHNNFRSAAAEISKETGVFWCFSCQEHKSLIEVVMHASGRSYFESVRLIDSKADSKNLLEAISSTLEKKKQFIEYDLEVINKLHNNVFRNKRAQEYFDSRNITKDSVIKYQLGYSENQDMVTIPIYSPEGLCIGFVARSVEGKVFKNTPGLQKSKTFFNLHRAKRHDKVFVVESSFDAIRLEQVGAHAVASLGSTISKDQRSLLKQYFNQVIVLGDNDDAGRVMAQKVIETFGPGCIAPKLPEGIKDVSDLSDKDLKIFVDKFDDLVSSMLK